MVGTITGLIGTAVSLIALVITLVDRRKVDQLRRREDAHGITVHLQELREEIHDFSWSHLGDQIVVRNDSTRPIEILSVHLVFGTRYIVDRSRPTYLSLIGVPPGRLTQFLTPGATMSVPAPIQEDVESLGGSWPAGSEALGPGVIFRDGDGREWQRNQLMLRQVNRASSTRAIRRGIWFEQHRWFTALDDWFYRRAVRKARRHPARLPWEVRFAGILWGWRAGMQSDSTLPPGAPPTWRYNELLPHG